MKILFDGVDPIADTKTVSLACNGNCTEVMQIQRIDWGDELQYAVNFRADTFYSGQSPVGIMKARIKFAWLALTKGNYIHNEILTSREALVTLRDGLTEMLSNPDTAGDIDSTYMKHVSVSALDAKK